jgi:DNA-binding NarL/FixJ family response regulator
LNKFDFSYDEYQRFLERCPFSKEEIEILNLRRKGYSITQIAIKLNICDRTVSKRINSICKKILKEI